MLTWTAVAWPWVGLIFSQARPLNGHFPAPCSYRLASMWTIPPVISFKAAVPNLFGFGDWKWGGSGGWGRGDDSTYAAVEYTHVLARILCSPVLNGPCLGMGKG